MGRVGQLQRQYHLFCKWLVAVLNSEVLEFVICQLTNSIRGGFVRLFTDSTELLPIMVPSGSLLAELEASVDRQDDGRANRAVAGLYGLSENDQDELARWFAKRSLLAQDAESQEADD